jgi:hypothetical protein
VTVSVAAAHGWPLRWARTAITLDGAPIGDGVPVAVSGEVHIVESIVDFDVPCGPLAMPSVSIRLRDLHTLAVSGAARVVIEVLDSGDQTRPPAERLRTRWKLSGAKDESGGPAEPFPARCRALSAIPAVVECGVADRLEHARQRRDVVETLCVYNKLTAIRASLPRAIEGNAEASAAIVRFGDEAQRCRGHMLYLLGDLTTEKDDCGIELP